MPITLFCLIKGNTSEKAFSVKISRDEPISELKDAIKAKNPQTFANVDTKDIKLWKVSIPGDQDDQLRNLILQDSDELLAIRKISKYFPDSPLEEHIHIIVKLPLLSLEEALSCIPPPITYSSDCVTSKTTTKASGDPPDQTTYIQGNLLTLPASLILVMEAKRKHVLEDMGEETFPEFYQTSKGKDVVQQIYNYMGGNELRYGILSTYDNHWFLRREHAKLWISKTLSLQSESPPVLKAYAYLTRRAKENPKSPKPQIVVPAHGDNNSRNLRSHSKSSSSSSLNNQASSTSANQQSSSITPVDQQNLSFTDFKFKGILGEGRSGKTLLCEFRGDMIALKSVDLSKAPSYVLEEMQKEVEIYKDLADIQGKYIPKLICYGYYGGGMSFVIGLTIVGTMLSDQKITEQQKSRAIKGLEAIHKHGILHNDIREENILINDKGVLYLIDFGMASREDTKKKRKLFDEEQLKLSQLLDGYIVHFVKKEGRTSKSRKCKVVS
ncbi:kinase-like domain-containing protein [Rhizophagus clarus]|uniref:Kinase-like domain-containing protein n=1 Tax=Rhizophagus clarus TaxID=94130 RepID=A0A8H3QSN6_9GLOM|nr:kinase-like domain-containing protein [Rhizophagus clarus]